MSNLAVITARGGSKRIPRKNIKDFCGKPIISYSIEAAIESNIFDEVMVSTEDEEIMNIALQYGAKVPFMRSDATAGDMAMTHDVVLEVLDEYRKMGKEFDYVCCIYPTAPFITGKKLQDSYEKLVESDVDTVLPVVAFSFPPQRCFIIQNGSAVFKWPENRLVRSQDLEKFYHDSGQYYFMNVKRFEETHNMIMEKTIPIIVDEMEVQDIDNYEDWELAELKYKMRKKREGQLL